MCNVSQYTVVVFVVYLFVSIVEGTNKNIRNKKKHEIYRIKEFGCFVTPVYMFTPIYCEYSCMLADGSASKIELHLMFLSMTMLEPDIFTF